LPGGLRRLRQQPQHGSRGDGLPGAGLAADRAALPRGDLEVHAVARVDVPGVGREADVEVLDGQARSAVRLGHADTSCCGALRRPRRERRVRRRGSLRSLMDSPTRVTPSTARAIARPGNTPVHQMPLVASAIARLRSYPHSEALVGSIPKPRNPSAARVRIDSEAFSVKISGRVRVELRSRCVPMMRRCPVPTTFAASTNGSAFSRTTSARITRKYCGMNTTVIERAAAAMPPQASDWPPEITMDITIASSREGKA